MRTLDRILIGLDNFRHFWFHLFLHFAQTFGQKRWHRFLTCSFRIFVIISWWRGFHRFVTVDRSDLFRLDNYVLRFFTARFSTSLLIVLRLSWTFRYGDCTVKLTVLWAKKNILLYIIKRSCLLEQSPSRMILTPCLMIRCWCSRRQHCLFLPFSSEWISGIEFLFVCPKERPPDACQQSRSGRTDISGNSSGSQRLECTRCCSCRRNSEILFSTKKKKKKKKKKRHNAFEGNCLKY